MQLILYSTDACHLCEQAKVVIGRALGITVAEIDIAADEHLLARYGVRIPVLRRLDTATEIGWPFTEADVLALVREPFKP